MLDGLKGMAGLAGLMKDLPKIKARMEEVKARLGERTVTAETGGGAVRVSANGLLKIVSIEVDPALLAGLVDVSDPDDRTMAVDLLTNAVNTAIEKAREMAEGEFGAAAEDLGLPIPAGGLGGLLG